MDGKTNANIINAVADGIGIPCKSCGALNKPTSKFCTKCGSPMAKPAEPVEAAVKEEPVKPQEGVFKKLDKMEEKTKDVLGKIADGKTKDVLGKIASATESVTKQAFNAKGIGQKKEEPEAQTEMVFKPKETTPVKEVPKAEKQKIVPEQGAKPVFDNKKKNEAKKSEYKEPTSVFAEGLPDWTLEPPQIMVRRH